MMTLMVAMFEPARVTEPETRVVDALMVVCCMTLPEQLMFASCAVPVAPFNWMPSRGIPSAVMFTDALIWAVYAFVPTGPYATTGGWMTCRVVSADVMPVIWRALCRSMALVPLAISAVVVNICRTLRLAFRPVLETDVFEQLFMLPLGSVGGLIQNNWQSLICWVDENVNRLPRPPLDATQAPGALVPLQFTLMI